MRSQDLKAIRDKRIVEKFYQLYDVKRMRIDDVIKEMSEEHFFLTEEYIYARIFYNKKNKEYYGELLDKQLQKAE